MRLKPKILGHLLPIIGLFLLSACGAQGETIPAVQGEISIPYGQNYGLFLGPNSSFSLPGTKNGSVIFKVGENDKIEISGNNVVNLTDGTYQVGLCKVAPLGIDDKTNTFVIFQIGCDVPPPSPTPSPTPSPEAIH